MLNAKDKGRIIRTVEYCDRIQSKMRNTDPDMFQNDQDLREIICFNIFQIGELAKGLSDDFVRQYHQIPWKQIKGMRDIIGHGYGTIDIDIVYNTAKESIPELKRYCIGILDNTPES